MAPPFLRTQHSAAGPIPFAHRAESPGRIASVAQRCLNIQRMGHKDIQTTQRYADYCPNPGEREVVEAAFARGTNLRPMPGNSAQLNATENAGAERTAYRRVGSSPTPGARSRRRRCGRRLVEARGSRQSVRDAWTPGWVAGE
jgi:hypothetical protein